MTISVRLNDKETELIKAYAEMNNISLSDLVRNAVIEKIENEYDLECYKKAMEEYKKNPKTYTIEEIKEIEIVGKKRQYYVLKFAIGNMVTNVPIENSEEIGIRPVIEKQEAKKALQYFRDAELEDDANWNKRQRDNLIKIKSGDIYQVILVLKELMYREKIKGLSTSERKTLTSAKQIVVSELVLSEVADVSDIESILNDTVDALV